MARYVVRRLLFAAVLIAAASSSALLLTRLAPGDVTTELGPFATQAEIAATRERFALNRSPLSQWGDWVGRVVRLDFGQSFLYGRPVAPLVARAAVNTALLALSALITATVLGVSGGLVTGSASGGALPAAIRTASLVLISMPPLVMSLLLVFAAARTGWLPTGGMSSPLASGLAWGPWLADLARHLPIPVLALALPLAASFERLQAQSLAETVHQPFVVAAIARGVAPDEVIVRHAWPVSLRPLCAMYGIAIGALLSGSFVVEFITAWPGLGRLMYDALRARDIYLVAGCAAVGATFLAAGSLAGDLLLAMIDPQTREGHTA